ncbi:MAG: hypothetical protein JSV16_05350, partial [Candidatus Hydrogenedentota bacterium]
DPSSGKELYIRFYELKAAAFVLDFDGELTRSLPSPKVPRSGHRVRLIFADEEELTGYMFDWASPGDNFYLFPDSMGKNVLFLLIEKHTLKDIILLNEDAEEAKRAQENFAPVLKRIKSEIES